MAGLDLEGLRILGAREGEGGRMEIWGKLGETGSEKAQTYVLSCRHLLVAAPQGEQLQQQRLANIFP